MTTSELCVTLRRRAAALAGDVPGFALDEAVREVAAVIATARLGSARDDEVGEIDPVSLDAQAAIAAGWAKDYSRWSRYHARAAAR